LVFSVDSLGVHDAPKIWVCKLEHASEWQGRNYVEKHAA
jgi:hypothetical protein